MRRAFMATGSMCIALGAGYLLAAAIAPPSPGSGHLAVAAPTPSVSAQQPSPSVHPSLSSETTRRADGTAGAAAIPRHATVVSLTFDDGSASEYTTLDMLRSHHMSGTFYINTEMVESSAYYMTWQQVYDLAAAGNEIAGHTLHHVNLPTVTPAEQRTEVCDDRRALAAAGLGNVSFAFPYGAFDTRAEDVVRSCGYQSARVTGGLWYQGCGSCPTAETIPPANPYAIRVAPPATTATTLADLQASVTTAEAHGGGWLPYVFHGICDDLCTADNSLSPTTFKAFLDWLAPRASKGTIVRTVGQVMNAPRPPARR